MQFFLLTACFMIKASLKKPTQQYSLYVAYKHEVQQRLLHRICK